MYIMNVYLMSNGEQSGSNELTVALKPVMRKLALRRNFIEEKAERRGICFVLTQDQREERCFFYFMLWDREVK